MDSDHGADMLIDLGTAPVAADVGAKAARLGWLLAGGYRVPGGAALPFHHAAALVRTDDAVDLREALGRLIVPGRRYAVRSSANVEDHGERSFAGQFASVLDVSDVDAALAAARVVAGSAHSERALAYAARVGVDPAGLRMAVIFQEMARPRVSGVAFSRDPVTGADETVVEAVEGRGDALVGRGVEPARWRVGARGVCTAPDVPPLGESVLAEIVDTVRSVASQAGQPADVEWVWDGHEVHLVQWRPITGLGVEGRTWSSRMARDMLPGLIPPLVWSINVPVLSRVWVDLIEETLGPTGVHADDLVRPFGYRAYFNTGALGEVFASLGMPRDSLDRMRDGEGASRPRPPMRVMARSAPRLARTGWRLARWDRRAETERADIEARRAAEALVDPNRLSDAAIVARVDRLRGLLAQVARLNVITPLLADAWAASVRRGAVARGVDAGTVEPGQDSADLRDLDPAHALATLDPDDPAARAAFLTRFGHLSDSPNDCSRPTWGEDPETVARLFSARSDAARLGPPSSGRASLLAATPTWQRPLVAWQWDRAAAVRVARDRVGHTYARVYGLFRPTFLAVGERLVERGVLQARDDVFLLSWAEVRTALGGGPDDAAGLVARRRDEMAEAAELTWPETIIGDDPVPIRGRGGARTLRGVPTSRGRHVGTARVVTSMASAPDVAPTDVLVLSAADVTWTTLLLRVGAVVTETGGMLSHASIVARELGIPCVASVDGATGIPDGARVAVDGGAGEVLVLEEEP
jgi:phosphoenolpyruvate synthase/pyruvate phosphate dikinase